MSDEPIQSMRLSRRGKITVSLIQRAYEAGKSVEDIAKSLGMEVEHVQFLMTLDTLQNE